MWPPLVKSCDACCMDGSQEMTTPEPLDAQGAPGPQSVGESAAAGEGGLVDLRASRFGAAITCVVLALALILLPAPASVVLLVVQGVAFGCGGILGLRFQPYGWAFRKWVKPRLGPPTAFETEGPPRFAQVVGLAFVIVALVALWLNLVPLAAVAVSLAWAAAFLNAVFGFCLGCEMYLIFKRATPRRP